MATVNTEQSAENMEYVRRLLKQKQPGFSAALELDADLVGRELESPKCCATTVLPSLGPPANSWTGGNDVPVRLGSARGWQALAEVGTRPQRLLWASTSTKNPDLPDTYYLGRLAAPSTIDTVPEKTLLAFADYGTLDDRLDPDYAAAEQNISAVADAGVDADALAERLQRIGAGAFSADWTALLTAIEEKAQKLKPEASE